MNKCFLVLSHHRSGSNFLCNLLCANNDVTCLNEPLSMHTDFFKEKDLISWEYSEYNSEYLHTSLIGQNELISYLKELKSYLVEESIGDRLIGFKETLLFAKLPWLKQFIPEIKIVYLVRDPRAVVNSVMRNSMYKLWKYETIIPRYLKLNNMYNETIDLTNPIELAVWSWKIRNGLFDKYKNLFEYKIIKLEDIVKDPINEAENLMHFLGKTLSEQQSEFLLKVYGEEKKGEAFSVFTTKNRVLNDWKDKVSFEDEQYIRRNLYKEMEKYGYL